MRSIVKQLNEVIEHWSQKHALSAALVELPEIYMNQEKYIDCFKARELESLNRIASRKRRVSRIAGRLAARIALQRFLPGNFTDISDSSMEILNDEYGKPYLTANNDICVSISHSGSCAIAVVSKTRVGVDLEQAGIRPESFINTFFLPSEQNWIRKTAESSVWRANCLWTRKEAASKLLGVGGNVPFKSIPVLDNESEFEFDSHQIDHYCLSLATHKRLKDE
ncbi:MAG: 4'-phosphopantetheinyl transferase superfamily protein [Fibrobacter sp.]|nr:4'-phosphopantetheinyl transferase superfamily protein [Fibrobacter sp.]